jgi:hypothetical protein
LGAYSSYSWDFGSCTLSKNAIATLGAAISAALSADPALSLIIAGRIYDAAPPAATAPYLVIGRHEIRPLGGTAPAGSAEAQEIVLTLSILSQAEGLAEARSAAAAVRAVLHNARLTLDGWRLVQLRVVFVDVYRGADGRTALGLVRLRAAVEPL